MEYRLIHADVIAGLRQLADQSVQCAVTSPPYWGLRDYGLPPSVWGGDPEHAHEWGGATERTTAHVPSDASTLGGGRDARQKPSSSSSSSCECGAWLGCLGLEPTPDLFVGHIVTVFREVRRVLRDDGTLWLNLGDSYAGSGKGGDYGNSPKQATSAGSIGVSAKVNAVTNHALRLAGSGDYKAKDLIGIPWMVAFALRADGWYLRSDVIWSKPNPMPESVTDRPTKAHEYLFLLSKKPTYFYDADAIREPAAYLQPNAPDAIKSPYGQGFTRRADARPGISGWARGEGSHDAAAHNVAGRAKGAPRPKGNAKTFRGGGAYTGNRSFDNSADVERESHGNEPNETLTRNKRSVWTIATAPFPEAHFATFPPDLIEPCILAGSRIGDTILDPFNGAATSGVVALSHQRDYVGIELSADYVEMSRRRLAAIAPMFAKESHGA